MAEEARNIANGNPGDVDFMGMIQSFRDQRYEASAATPRLVFRGRLRAKESLLPHIYTVSRCFACLHKFGAHWDECLVRQGGLVAAEKDVASGSHLC